MMGPKRVWKDWEELGEQPNNDVIDIVGNGLRGYMIQTGMYNPDKPGPKPYAKDVTFFRPGFVMSMPQSVKILGATSVGPFTGRYSPKTREVTAELELMSISSGKGSNRVTPKITIHGKVEGTQVLAEVDGKKVDPNAKSPFKSRLPDPDDE
jgi:hypothetical protein